jgi:aspartate--ammonia ligase
MPDKKADLAGPGISTYAEVDKVLPTGYNSILSPKETQKAIYAVKRFIEDELAKELNLQLVQVPLIVEKESGMNDNLDRDGSRTPVDFPCGLGITPRMNAQAVCPEAVRLRRRRGHQYRHARRPQGLLPRSRPQFLR